MLLRVSTLAEHFTSLLARFRRSDAHLSSRPALLRLSYVGFRFANRRPPPWVLALVLSFIGWNLAGSVLYSCDTANVFDLNCDDLSDVDQPSRGIAKLIGTTAFVLGSLCTAVIWLSSVCCCCVHPMNAPQWKKCGGALIAAAVLEGVSFIVFLESFDFDSSKIGSGGQSAILAVICWIGAGISASAYSEQNSSNTIVAQRRAARS
mmetsp:Transcript_31709/g.72765  ORF Transcript_31709/g.72765 Transcript_31709/m.72765 type:complete len:206 (-) Transcript_31709:292-909(-)